MKELAIWYGKGYGVTPRHQCLCNDSHYQKGEIKALHCRFKSQKSQYHSVKKLHYRQDSCIELHCFSSTQILLARCAKSIQVNVLIIQKMPPVTAIIMLDYYY